MFSRINVQLLADYSVVRVHVVAADFWIFLLPQDCHICIDGIGSQSSNSGPTMDILIRLSSVLVLSRLRNGLFIQFNVEKKNALLLHLSQEGWKCELKYLILRGMQQSFLPALPP